jgi:predicted phosphodiesterase
MCALIVGDIHGNYAKAKAFLDYKPEEEHIFVGDLYDSYTATDYTILTTAEMIYNSNATILSGNHDNQYFKSSGDFTMCSGCRYGMIQIFQTLVEKNKHKINASCIRDGFFICHGGVQDLFGEKFNTIEDMNDFCNSEFDEFKNLPIVETNPSIIFNINSFRGGNDAFSGIFWASYGYDKFDERFNIVCGHTHKKEPRSTLQLSTEGLVTMHVCVDCDKFMCFNTVTRKFEDMIPESMKQDRDKYEINF